MIVSLVFGGSSVATFLVLVPVTLLCFELVLNGCSVYETHVPTPRYVSIVLDLISNIRFVSGGILVFLKVRFTKNRNMNGGDMDTSKLGNKITSRDAHRGGLNVIAGVTASDTFVSHDH